MTKSKTELSDPKVSVLIPCYNSERFVGEAVQSALDQTYSNIEVVVVDDGSTDGSVDVLRSFGDKIRIETGPNQGACIARNRAFELSDGEYVQYLDSDDRIEPTKVEKQLRWITSNKADMVLCKIGLFGDEEGPRLEGHQHPEPTGDPMLYLAKFGIQTASSVWSRDLVDRVNGFTPGLKRGQEADFHLRIASLNPKLVMLDEILVWVRMHDGPKVSRRKANKGQIVECLCNLANLIESNQTWTPDRRKWLARQLIDASRVCFACGDRKKAIMGLKAAVSALPEIVKEDRLSRRFLTTLLGIERAESLVCLLRRLANRS